MTSAPLQATHRLATRATVVGVLLSISLGSMFAFGPLMSPALDAWAQEHLLLYLGGLVLVLLAFPLLFAFTPWFASQWVVSEEELRFMHMSHPGASSRALGNSGFVRLSRSLLWTTATRDDRRTFRLPRSLRVVQGGREVTLEFSLVGDRLSLVEVQHPSHPPQA